MLYVGEKWWLRSLSTATAKYSASAVLYRTNGISPKSASGLQGDSKGKPKHRRQRRRRCGSPPGTQRGVSSPDKSNRTSPKPRRTPSSMCS